MHGVALSRWTMSYFAAALAALMAAEVLMAAGYGFPSAPLRAPETLLLVHLVAIGWLSLLLCGALFQFVPVLVARPLFSNMLPLPTLVLLLAGLVALLMGFLQLGGALGAWPWLLPVAASLLAGGFMLALYNLGRTLWAARPLPLPARFVAVALVFLAATIALGALFSSAFAGLVTSDALLRIAGEGVGLHAVAGIGGWLTFTAMGVSYRLLAMFMLAPETDGSRPRAVFGLGTAALGVAVLGGVILVVFDMPSGLALIAGGAAGLAGIALYGADMAMLYRKRKRRVIELNSQMAAWALAYFFASIALALILIGLGVFYDHIGAVVFLLAFGWLSGLGLAKLYKIVAFMTWLECYGPVLGRMPTPRVQDLVVEGPARKWFVLYFLSVLAATAALLGQHILGFRLAAGLMVVATALIAAHLVRTRRLAGIGLAGGVRRPHLFLPGPEPAQP
ncbi:hypothetical protein [Pelagibacterium sediminicola]|uniref:hypothetical protein n=1 Tax=Pelagibacterium sediminicola TaxID=2248761 RepID=UPI000E310969|nr:hypothetical protein [Pelagibacterium sediminicola]